MITDYSEHCQVLVLCRMQTPALFICLQPGSPDPGACDPGTLWGPDGPSAVPKDRKSGGWCMHAHRIGI